MSSKVKVVVITIIGVFALSLILLGIKSALGTLKELDDGYDYKKADSYVKKIKKLCDAQDEFLVGDVFQFEYDRAYVFKDNYMSGESFARQYNLDISINQVEAVDTEILRRIVFVDENGDYIYEFRYNVEKLTLMEEGMIIYPETIIKKEGIEPNGRCIIELVGNYKYYYDRNID